MEFLSNVIQLLIDRKEFFANLIVEHLVLSFSAIVLITVLGIALGIYSSINKKAAKLIMSAVNFLYTIPSIAMFGVFISIVGIGNKNAIPVLTIYGILPVIRNTYVGIEEVDDSIIEAAKGMGSTNKQLLTKIKLPLALPVILAGLRTMIVMTIALAGIASFIGAGGLGIAIWRGITTNFKEMIFVGSILVALLAVLADLSFGFFERKMLKKVFGTSRYGGEINV
jgi:osmoprotectant transport system permease protein